MNAAKSIYHLRSGRPCGVPGQGIEATNHDEREPEKDRGHLVTTQRVGLARPDTADVRPAPHRSACRTTCSTAQNRRPGFFMAAPKSPNAACVIGLRNTYRTDAEQDLRVERRHEPEAGAIVRGFHGLRPDAPARLGQMPRLLSGAQATAARSEPSALRHKSCQRLQDVRDFRHRGLARVRRVPLPSTHREAASA